MVKWSNIPLLYRIPNGIVSSDRPFGEGPFRLLARASTRMDIEKVGFLGLSGLLW